MFVACEQWVETRTDCYTDPTPSLDHSSTSLASSLELPNHGSLRATKPPVSKMVLHAGILSPTDSNRPDIWLYYFLMPTFFSLFFCLFTLVCISWLTTRSRVNIITIIPFLIFSKIPHVDIFLTSLSIPLTPHILQIMLTDNNSKNTKRNYLNNRKIQKS